MGLGDLLIGDQRGENRSLGVQIARAMSYLAGERRRAARAVPVLLKSTIYFLTALARFRVEGVVKRWGAHCVLFGWGSISGNRLVTDPSSDATPTPQTRSLRRCCRWAPRGPYYVEVQTRSRHSRAATRPRAARAAPPMPPGHRPRLSALSALRSVRETGEGRTARRLQSRQRHCVASAGGVPARPPAPVPAHAAPAGSGCAALLLLLLDGSPRVLVDGSAAWSRGRR